MTDDRLYDLATRYFHGGLTDAERAELSATVRGSAAARRLVADLSLQVVGLSERFARPARPGRRVRGGHGPWAVGLAAAVVLAVVGWRGLRDRPGLAAAVAEVEGPVGRVLLGPGGHPLTAGVPIGAGQLVSTVGVGSGVTLRCRDGSRLFLAGDTTVAVTADGGTRVAVTAGDFAADVADRPVEITTPEARLAVQDGRVLVTSREGQTRVGVIEGHAHVADPDGTPLLDMGTGEEGVVEADGAARKEPAAPPPDDYRWRADRPLPPGWELGRLADDPSAGPAGRAFLAERWTDRYLGYPCWGIRSENRWGRGLYHVHPDTRFRVTYKVDRPGRGQLLAVVRKDPADPKSCNVLLAPIPFDPAPGGGWRTVELAAADWVVETRPGRIPLDHPMPWVVFLVAFNTYNTHLGLRVAEFAVTRGPVPPAREEP